MGISISISISVSISVVFAAMRQLFERSKPKKQSRFAIAGFLRQALRSESAFPLHGDGQRGERSLQGSRLLGPACVAGSEVCRRHGSSGGAWGGRSLPGSGPRAHLSKDGEAMCLWSCGQQKSGPGCIPSSPNRLRAAQWLRLSRNYRGRCRPFSTSDSPSPGGMRAPGFSESAVKGKTRSSSTARSAVISSRLA